MVDVYMLLMTRYVGFVVENKEKKSGGGDSNKIRIALNDSLLPESRAAKSSSTLTLVKLPLIIAVHESLIQSCLNPNHYCFETSG